jgi:hypothetical protein
VVGYLARKEAFGVGFPEDTLVDLAAVAGLPVVQGQLGKVAWDQVDTEVVADPENQADTAEVALTSAVDIAFDAGHSAVG